MKPIPIKGGYMTWLMDDSIQPGADMSLAEMTILPGQTSELHGHSNCQEAIYLLKGNISQRIGDVWIEMSPGDSQLIPIGTLHQTRNQGSQDAKMMLVYSEGWREYQSFET